MSVMVPGDRITWSWIVIPLITNRAGVGGCGLTVLLKLLIPILFKDKSFAFELVPVHSANCSECKRPKQYLQRTDLAFPAKAIFHELVQP